MSFSFSESKSHKSEKFTNNNYQDKNDFANDNVSVKLDNLKFSSNLLIKLFNIYLNEAPNILLSLKQAVKTYQNDQIQFNAHSLKSSSRNLAAIHLGDLCERLEFGIRNQNLSKLDIDRLVDLIDAEFNQVNLFLVDYLQKHGD